MAKTRQKERPFVKMHGIGNDIVLFDCMKGGKGGLGSPNRTAKKVLDRHTGVGGDQLILLLKSRKADFQMKVFNTDGSEAEMCGNGLRCVARYIKDAKISSKKEFSVETLSGIKKVKLAGSMIEADMGEPRMKGKEIPVNLSGRVINRPIRIESREFRITCLSIGNPHCVVFSEDIANFPVERFGPILENHHLFPKRVNVEFVNVLSKKELQMRVWEKGVGETKSCGSGACAAVVAAVLNGFSERDVSVAQAGGTLFVEWNRKDGHIYLRGPAEIVFRGTIVL